MSRAHPREVVELGPAGEPVGQHDRVLPRRPDGRQQVVLGDGHRHLVVPLLDPEVPGQPAAATDTRHRGPGAGEQCGVGVITEAACCGLTWVSTGQLTAARRILGHTLDVLHPYVARGVPVVGLEPSCLATLRSDAVELSTDPRAAEVAAGVRSLAEVLSGLPGWTPPDLTGTSVVVQPHCHHASVLGWDADAALLARTGAEVTRVGGCCGLAGNFGVEQGHYEVSVAVAEHDLLPAVRAAGKDAVVLADGFSCRTQLDDLAGVRALHLAELLAGAPARETADVVVAPPG